MTRTVPSMVLLLGACAGSSPSDDSGDAGDTGTHAERFAIGGRVSDLAGEPVVGAFITVSTEFCIPDQTDITGTFEVTEVSPGAKRLITYGETASNGLFASVVFAFEADETTVLEDPVLAPALTEVHAVDPSATADQVIETADGLFLTIPVGSLTVAPFAPDEVQVARVPVEQAPPFVPDDLDILELFVLHPIRSTFDPPAPVAFPANTNLDPGTAVTFHSLNYETGELVPVASGTVGADGRPATDDGQGLVELTWIALSQEPG